MKIGVTGPDLLLNKGGSQIHTINVISNLINRYNFVYFPNPCLYSKFKSNIDEVQKNIDNLKKAGVIVTEQFYDIIKHNYSEKEVLEKYRRENCDILFNFDYLNTCISPNDFTIKLSSMMRVKFAVTVQGLADFNIHLFPYIRDTFRLSSTYRILLIRIYQYISRHILLYRLSHQKRIVKILMVNNSYNKNIKIKNKNIELLNPSNGIMNSIHTDNINVKKEDKIVFLARLVYNKGIFELPKILYLLNKSYRIKLVLIGKFLYENEKTEFVKLINKYGLNNLVEYRGFMDEPSMYHELSTSKLMIYPSHSDSFSIALSQALLSHTPVVAYNIPGIEIYNGLKPVKLVKEFDYNKFVEAALELLNMKDYSDLFDQEISNFISSHNWYDVAKQYIKVFDHLYQQ